MKLNKLALNFIMFLSIGLVGMSFVFKADPGLSITDPEIPVSQEDEMPDSWEAVISWEYSVEYGEGDEATLIITARQKDHWHIYSQFSPDGAVNEPTSFIFVPSDKYELVGKTKERGAKLESEDGIAARFFPGTKAVFKQKIKILSKSDFKIDIKTTFMACKNSCFPPVWDHPGSFNVKGIDNLGTSGEATPEETPVEDTAATADTVTTNEVVETAEEGDCYPDPRVKWKIYSYRNTDFEYTAYIEAFVDSGWRLAPNGSQIGDLKTSNFKLILPEGAEALDKEPQVDGASEKIWVESMKDSVDGYTGIYKIYQKFKLKDTSTMPDIKAEVDYVAFSEDGLQQNCNMVSGSANLKDAVDTRTDNLEKGTWLIFFLAFGSGLLALLTPCVFPMIPMTVTFFTKQSKTKSEGIRKAILYGISIIVIYVILGVAVSSIWGDAAVNDLATNIYMNIAFFVLFVVFAISFFGAFEIKLPSSWINKADAQADKGGLIGIFFMAFTLALVSFSCTGPIVGTVLVQSAQGGWIGPIMAMLGFSSALALPFALFAAFPGWLNSMPQSGGWLNVVKVVLGFAELAFALKFLSNADLVVQGHFLEREVFVALWVGIFFAMAIYLFGFIQFPHDSKVEKLGVGRGMIGLLSLSFALYMLPGLWGAPLNILSGIVPSISYSESPYGFHNFEPERDPDLPESAEYHNGFWVITDYKDGVDYAKLKGKPIIVDFSGYACVNCRKMEDQVWVNGEVAPIMREKYVIISLMVDDKTAFSKEEKERYADMLTPEMTAKGDLWKAMERDGYGQISQPLYSVIDHNEMPINGTASYETHGNPEDFHDWLKKGLTAWDAVKGVKVIDHDIKDINWKQISLVK